MPEWTCERTAESIALKLTWLDKAMDCKYLLIDRNKWKIQNIQLITEIA